MELTRLPELAPEGKPLSQRAFLEFTRAKDLSVGVYLVPAGQEDHQSPHDEDEVYYVVRGKAGFESPQGRVEARPGDCIHVPAREPHRFVDVEEDLVLLVVFAPAYRSRASDAS